MSKKDLSTSVFLKDSKKPDHHFRMCEMQFRTSNWHTRHVKLGKHNEKSNGVQHSIKLLLQSSLIVQMFLSSRYMRSENDFDNYNSCADITRDDIKRGFARKYESRSKSTFSNYLKCRILLLFNQSVNQQPGQIEHSKKASKHEAA